MHHWHPHEAADIARKALDYNAAQPLQGTATLVALRAVIPDYSRLADGIHRLLTSDDGRVEPAATILSRIIADCGPKVLDEALTFMVGTATPATVEAWLTIIAELPSPETLRAVFPTYCVDGWTREGA